MNFFPKLNVKLCLLFTFSLIFFNAIVAQTPVINSFSPLSGPVGTTVTILGSNFSTIPTNNFVYFGGVKSTVLTASATTLNVSVPNGAKYAPITVTANNLTAYSSKFYNVTFMGASNYFNTNSLSPRIDYSTGSATVYPNAVDAADFDDDGKIDIVLANSGVANFSIYKNQTISDSIIFAAPVKYSTTGNANVDVTIADMDGDGKQDILIAGKTYNSFSIYRNTSVSGVISFAPEVNFPTGSTVSKICARDLDNDGKPDIILGNNNALTNSLSIYRNISIGTSFSFDTKINLASSTVDDISLGDLNNDGKTDIAMVNLNTGYVYVFENTSSVGSISFNAAQLFAAGKNTSSVAIGDLNQDGKLDIAACNDQGFSVSSLRNITTTGTISFAPKVDFGVSSSPFKVGIADVNGNGLPDILVTEYSNRFLIGLNTSTASQLSFGGTIGYALPGISNSIAVSDFNNDGKNDLLFGHTFITNPVMSVYKNTTTNPIFTPNLYAAAPGTTVILNGSGYLNTTTSINVGGISVSFAVIDSANVSFVVPVGLTETYVPIVLTTQYGTGKFDYFNVILPPQILSFSPDSGYNGSTINIKGKFLLNTYSVSFGGVQAASFYTQNDSLITATVSIGANGPVSVISNELTGSLNGFRFIGPSLISFSPDSANIGDTVMLRGTHFTGVTGVSFGGTAASTFSILNDSTIRAKVGLGNSGTIAVTGTRGTATIDGFVYTAPIITSFTPTITGSGNQVTITGKNFTGASIVKFGGTNASSFIINSSTSITAIVDTGSTGSVSVSTSFGTTSRTGFKFARVPEIYSITPDSAGPGITISIRGRYFSNTSLVSIGGINATSFAVTTDTTIIAVVGTGASGNIIIATPGGRDTLGGFVWVAKPTIISFSPINGGTGTVDTIKGTNLSNTSYVMFGKLNASSFTIVSDSLIIAIVGAGTTGTVSLGTRGGIATKSGFIYFPPPTINSFSPTSTSTNYPVTIKGTNFTDVLSVSFGGISAVSFTVNSDTSITAILGGGASGNIMVTTNYGTASITGFIFTSPMTITSFSPTTAKLGEIVTIKGIKFNSGISSVKLGGTPATTISVVSDSVINVTVGNGSSGAITITNSYQTATLGGFTYIKIPVITSFTPDTGSVGDTVIISGQNFGTSSSNNIVYFGTAVGNIISASTSSISVVVPSGATYAPITVTTNGLIASSYRPFTKTFSSATLVNGSFGDRLDLPVGINPESVAVGDLDGDGKMDLAVANYNNFSISIYRNIGSVDSIQFAQRKDISTGKNPHNITISDLNGDGKQELIYLSAIEGYAQHLAVLKNNSSTGNISFDTAITFNSIYELGDLAIIDADLDGKPDIFVTNAYRNGGVIGVISYFMNRSMNGNLSFNYGLSNYNSFGTDYLMQSLAGGDYNNDNKPDIAIGSSGTSLPLLINSSYGPGFLQMSFQNYGYTFGHSIWHISAVDFDKDGKTDILTEETYYKNLTPNGGSIYFTQPVYFSTRGYATADDMDGDGKPEVVKGLAPAGLTVTKNTSTLGSISFATNIKYGSLENPRAIATGDLDGDGKPEIVAVNYSGNSISILKNKIGSLVQLCPPLANTTITTNLKGTNYKWQMNTGNGYTNITDGPNFANTNSRTISLINIPSSWHDRKFRCLTDNNPGFVYTIQFVNSWIGSVNNSWENPLNWSCGTVPDINTDVEINSGTTIINSNVSIRSLTVNPTATVTVNAGNNITIVH